MKKCTKCKNDFSLIYFQKNKATKDGFEPVCRKCKSNAARQLREVRLKSGLCVCGRKLLNGMRKCSVCKQRQDDWAKKNPDKKRVSQKIYVKKSVPIIWDSILKVYGNKCCCCNESRPEFLTIDHINGGGNKHRKEIGRKSIYRWLVEQKFPPGFRILCYNCNCARGRFGYCPHEFEK